MPKKNCDYSKTVMYKIVCNDLNITDCYVGHTTDFIKRKYKHKHNTTNDKQRHYSLYVYQFIRDNGGWNNWTMIEIEKYPCNDGNEARTKERFWYEQLSATLNSIKPIITKDEAKDEAKEYSIEYIKKNKEILKEKWTNYYYENKEIIKEKGVDYRINNKDAIKERGAKYYHDNIEVLKKKHLEYYKNNKEKLKEKLNAKINCECGGKHTHTNKAIHKKTKKHLDYTNNLEV